MNHSRRRSLQGVIGAVLGCCVVGILAVTAQADQGPALTAGPPGGLVVANADAVVAGQAVQSAQQAAGDTSGKAPKAPKVGPKAPKGGPKAPKAKQLLYHNGPVMASGAAVTAVFWGMSWSDASFAGDKVSGLDVFYGGSGGNPGLSGSPYMKSNIEYTQSGGAHVSSTVTYSGHVFDATATPTGAPSTSAVLASVARSIANPVTNGYYPVYSDQPRGSAGYCAWHTYGTIRGVSVQFAFFFKLDGDSGCNPNDPGTIHSQGLEALANVSGHELSEAVTDPHLNGWYDQDGAENSDKCAWTFGPAVTLGGQSWKVQGNWSNAATGTGTSYVGSASGCIQTG